MSLAPLRITHNNLLGKLLQQLVVVGLELLEVGQVVLGVGVAVRTEVLVDRVSLALQNTHATTVEPVAAALATDVKSVRRRLL